MQPPAVLRAPVLCMRLLQRRSHVVVVALPARVASLTPPCAAPSRSPSPTLPSQQGLGAGVVKQGSLDARYARLCAVDAHSRWLRRWVPDMVRLSAAHMLAQAVPSQNLHTVAPPHQASWMLFTGEFIGARLCVCARASVRDAHLCVCCDPRFGHTSFRPPQRQIVDCLMRGEDAFVCMPTGGEERRAGA